MIRWFKKIGVGLGILLGITLLFLTGIRFYIETDQAQQMIQKKINGAIPGTLSWQRLDVSLLAGTIDLRSVVLEDPLNNQVAALEQLILDIDLLDLLKGNLAISTLTLTKPRADLAVDENGTLNLTTAFPSSDAPPKEKESDADGSELPINLTIGRLAITGGSVQYQTAAPVMAAGLSDINLDIHNFDLKKMRGDIRLGIGNGSFQDQAITSRLNRFFIETRLAKNTLDPLSAQIETDGISLSLDGRVSDIFATPLLSLTLKSDISLAKIKALLQMTPALDGDVSIALTADGPVANPSATLAIRYGGGSIFDQTVDSVDLNLKMDDRAVNLSELSVVSPLAKLIINGKADLRQAFPNGFLDEQKDLDAIEYQLTLKQTDAHIERVVPSQEGLGGDLTTTLALNGKGVDPKTLTAGATLDVSAKGMTAKGVAKPIDIELKAVAALAAYRATLNSLNLNAEGLRLNGKGKYDIASQSVSAGFGLDVPDLSSPLNLINAGGVKGGLKMDARIDGSGGRPAVSMNLSGASLGFRDIIIGDLALAANLDKTGKATINNLRLQNRASVLEAAGWISMFQEKFARQPNLPANLTLTLTDVAPGDFLPNAGFKGTINGSVALTEAIMTPKAQIKLDGKSLAVGRNTIGDVTAVLGLADGSLAIDTLRVANKRSVVTADGTADILADNLVPRKDPLFEINLTADPVYPNDFFDTLGGSIRFAAKARGPLSDLAADVSIQGEKLTVDENRIGNLDARLRMENGVVFLEPVKLKHQRSGLKITGQARIADPSTKAFLKEPVCDLTFAGDSLYLEDFLKGVKGHLSINGRIRGKAKTPEGSVTIQGKDFDLGGQKIGAILVDSRLDGQKAHIRDMKITVTPKAVLSGTGWVSLAADAFETRLSAKNFPLTAINAIRSQDMADGFLSLNLSGGGTFKNPRADGTINITGVTVNKKKMDNIALRLNLAEQFARVKGNMGFGIDGRYHLKNKTFDAALQFDNTDLAPYFKVAGQQNFSGKINGTITAEGDADTPDTISATVNLSHLGLFFKDKELITAPDVNIDYRNRKIEIPNLALRLLKRGDLTINGQGSLDKNLNLKVNGNIPLQVIEPFMDGLPNAKGDINIFAHMEGTLKKPDFHADLVLKNLGMTIPALEQTASNLNGRIRITPTAIEILDVKGRLDDGRFDLKGRIALDQLKPDKINATLNTHQLTIEVPDMLSITLNTELSLSGTADKSALTGEIEILEGQYYKNVDLKLTNAVKKNRSVAPAPKKTQTPFFSNMTININVTRREPFMVDNNLAFLSISPNLKVYGKTDNPLISGRAKVDSGIITFQQKEFKVQQGVIDFLNPYRIEPTVDIQGEVDVRTWTIRLTVSGTPDDLKFELTSSPMEDHADILSLIAFGKTTAELRGGDGGTFSPEQILADFVAETLQDSMKDATGLDYVDVKSGDLQEGGTPSRVKVTVGKDLSRWISVKYGVDIRNGETIQRVTTDYRILENLLISGFQDSGGDFGGELKYRLDFR